MLADALYSSSHHLQPDPPDNIAWADNIDYIEVFGQCAGDKIVIHGHDFGQPQPNEIDLMMNINGRCQPVNIPSNNWSDTQIEVTLPNGVQSGPIGFVNTEYVDAYNIWVTEANNKAERLVEALRCLGKPASKLPFIATILSPCPPTTSVNVINAGLPIISSFTANYGTTIVVEQGESIILRWNVENADDITLRRVSAIGPDFGGNATVQNPGGSSWDFGTTIHTSPEVYNYQLSVQNSCGVLTADVTVIATKATNLAIDRIEVTQGIQNLANSLPLIRSKLTVVRVYAQHDLQGFWNDQVPNVTGRLRTRRDGGGWDGWLDPINGSTAQPPVPTPGASITIPAAIDRENTDDTLNFILPTGRCRGELDFQVELRVDDFGAPVGSSGFSERVTRVFNSSPTGALPVGATINHFGFKHRRNITVRYIRVEWGGQTPTNAACQDTVRQGFYRLPANLSTATRLAGVGTQFPPNPLGLTDLQMAALPGISTAYLESAMNNLIDEFDDRHNCSIWEAATEWLGSDCPDDDDDIWMVICQPGFRGRAAGIPSNTFGTYANDFTKAAHEMSHCFDQEHIQLCDEEGGEDADDFPNRGTLDDVPFDIENNLTVRSGTQTIFGFTVPDAVKDIMTYCNIRWPHPARWVRLYFNIGS